MERLPSEITAYQEKTGDLMVNARLKEMRLMEPQKRMEAIEQLEPSEESVEMLIALLEDESHPVRFKAAEKLAEFGEASLEKLMEIMDTAEGEIRRYATFALKKIGDPRVTDHFIEALSDEDWGVRKFAARSLGELGDLRAVEPLIAALDDEDWGVKLAAVRSLGDPGDERAIEPIKKARRKGDKDFKKAANKSLKKIQSGR